MALEQGAPLPELQAAPVLSWPELSSPHAHTVPAEVSARLCSLPPAMATTPVRPLTGTGTVLYRPERPVPSCPEPVRPQDQTVPADVSARLWPTPPAMATAPVMPSTATGVALSIVVPLPNWPLPLRPQAWTVPSDVSDRLCRQPVAIAVTPPSPLTGTGVT